MNKPIKIAILLLLSVAALIFSLNGCSDDQSAQGEVFTLRGDTV